MSKQIQVAGKDNFEFLEVRKSADFMSSALYRKDTPLMMVTCDVNTGQTLTLIMYWKVVHSSNMERQLTPKIVLHVYCHYKFYQKVCLQSLSNHYFWVFLLVFDFTTINDVAHLAGFVSAMPIVSCMFELLEGAKMLNFLLIICIIYSVL